MKPGDGDCAALALGWEGSSGGQRRHADGPGAPRRPRKTRTALLTHVALSLPRPGPRELESPGIPTGSETRRDGKDDRTEEEKGQEKKKKKEGKGNNGGRDQKRKTMGKE